jgi:hypothetical protein
MIIITTLVRVLVGELGCLASGGHVFFCTCTPTEAHFANPVLQHGIFATMVACTVFCVHVETVLGTECAVVGIIGESNGGFVFTIAAYVVVAIIE